jgi:type IV pilus assembly protein PilA
VKKNTSGFTLIELLIVISIIGILISVLIPSIINSRKLSYDAGTQACGKSIQTAQGISQVDNKTFLLLGSGINNLNGSTDAINSACKFNSMFIKERSVSSNITSDYSIDVWDIRGSHVFTVTPDSFQKDAPGATPFSNTGAGGSNLP